MGLDVFGQVIRNHATVGEALAQLEAEHPVGIGHIRRSGQQNGAPIVIDAAYVNSHLGELAQDEDLSRYIL